jgi:hypothetical protein
MRSSDLRQKSFQEPIEGDEWFSEVEAEAVQYRTRVTPLSPEERQPDQELNPTDDDLTYYGVGGVQNLLNQIGGGD